MGNPRLIQASIKDVTFGEKVTIVEPSNLYGCALGDEVFVGPFVEIQRGVSIGKRTRIQSHTFICEGVTIGEDSFVSHGVMFVNDLFKTGGASRDPNDWKKTNIGARVSIGSGATILPVSICDDVVIGAGAVVTRDIKEPGIYSGVPAALHRKR
jgi:acetyltransferase-like isoleucine patch superfamily enzyme